MKKLIVTLIALEPLLYLVEGWFPLVEPLLGYDFAPTITLKTEQPKGYQLSLRSLILLTIKGF